MKKLVFLSFFMIQLCYGQINEQKIISDLLYQRTYEPENLIKKFKNVNLIDIFSYTSIGYCGKKKYKIDIYWEEIIKDPFQENEYILHGNITKSLPDNKKICAKLTGVVKILSIYRVKYDSLKDKNLYQNKRYLLKGEYKFYEDKPVNFGIYTGQVYTGIYTGQVYISFILEKKRKNDNDATDKNQFIVYYDMLNMFENSNFNNIIFKGKWCPIDLGVYDDKSCVGCIWGLEVPFPSDLNLNKSSVFFKPNPKYYKYGWKPKKPLKKTLKNNCD